MSYSHEEGASEEEVLLPSPVIAEQLKKLGVLGKALRSYGDPELLQYADELAQFSGILKEVILARGDEALLTQVEQPDYKGGRAIHLPFLPETQFDRSDFPQA